MREATSRTFENADGTFTSEVFSFPVHYQPEGSEDWAPIEVGFEATNEPDSVAVSGRAPATVSIGDSKSRTGFLSVQTGDYRIAFSLPAEALLRATAAKPTFEEARADWDGFLPGIDLRVIAAATGAKSFLVLEERPLLHEGRARPGRVWSLCPGVHRALEAREGAEDPSAVGGNLREA